MIAAVSLAASPASSDVQVISNGDTPPPSKVATILIGGEIKKGDAPFFDYLVGDLSRRTTLKYNGVPVIRVELDSVGGDISEAEAIGRTIRAHFLYTFVGDGKVCASACVLILAAGVDRVVLPGARIGVHRPYFDPNYFGGLSAQEARNKYDALRGAVKSYLAEIAASDDLFREMDRVESSSVRFLSDREILRLGLAGEDPAWEELTEAGGIKQFGPERWRWIQECQGHAHSATEAAGCYARVYQVYPKARPPLNFDDLVPAAPK